MNLFFSAKEFVGGSRPITGPFHWWLRDPEQIAGIVGRDLVRVFSTAPWSSADADGIGPFSPVNNCLLAIGVACLG